MNKKQLIFVFNIQTRNTLYLLGMLRWPVSPAPLRQCRSQLYGVRRENWTGLDDGPSAPTSDGIFARKESLIRALWLR